MTIKQMKDYMVRNYGFECWVTVYFFQCCETAGVRKWMLVDLLNKAPMMVEYDSEMDWLAAEVERHSLLSACARRTTQRG